MRIVCAAAATAAASKTKGKAKKEEVEVVPKAVPKSKGKKEEVEAVPKSKGQQDEVEAAPKSKAKKEEVEAAPKSKATKAAPAKGAKAKSDGSASSAGLPAAYAELPPLPEDRVRYSMGSLSTRLRSKTRDDDFVAKTLQQLYQDGILHTKDDDGFKAYVSTLRSLEYGGHWQWAVQVLGEMRDANPDVKNEHAQVCHHVVISAVGKAELWQRALEVMEDMPSAGFKPDFETYQALATAVSRNGQWQAALSLIVRGIEERQANHESYCIAMMACARENAWEAAIALLAGADETTAHETQKDEILYGIAAYACMQAKQWEAAVQLFADMKASKIDPDATCYACVQSACMAAGKSEIADKLTKQMADHGLREEAKEILSESMIVLDTPEMRNPIPIFAIADMCHKEVGVLKFVQSRSKRGDVDSVLAALESFAAERKWLKVQGDEKRILLEKTLRHGDRIVEMGCYVGYSSMVMARRIRQLGGEGSITSCDVDAPVAYIARAIHQWAGIEGEVQIRVGAAHDWILTGQLGEIDFLLLDHRGTIYHEDLHVAEDKLSEKAIVWADNVLHPGAPLFLNYVDVQGYTIEIHELQEFMKEGLDDWVVICVPPRKEDRKKWVKDDQPQEFRRLSAEIDAISWRSQSHSVDWIGFQERVSPIFMEWKKERGL